jgi:hypothetical protein
MDPLSLLCRLASSVPPPRFHTVKYAGVLAPASPWRSRIAPQCGAARVPPARSTTSGHSAWSMTLGVDHADTVALGRLAATARRQFEGQRDSLYHPGGSTHAICLLDNRSPWPS